MTKQERQELMQRMQSLKLSVAVQAYVMLHVQSGCRISDLLAVDYHCVLPSGKIIIRQNKGSEAMIIEPNEYEEFWESVRTNKIAPMLVYNRLFFYRLYSKLGLVSMNKANTKLRVTHSLRAAKAEEIYEATGDIQLTARALGHKSTKSTEYYVRNSSTNAKQLSGILQPGSGEVLPVRICKNNVITAVRQQTKKRKAAGVTKK